MVVADMREKNCAGACDNDIGDQQQVALKFLFVSLFAASFLSEEDYDWCKKNYDKSDDLLSCNSSAKNEDICKETKDGGKLEVDGGRSGFFVAQCEIVRDRCERMNSTRNHGQNGDFDWKRFYAEDKRNKNSYG